MNCNGGTAERGTSPQWQAQGLTGNPPLKGWLAAREEVIEGQLNESSYKFHYRPSTRMWMHSWADTFSCTCQASPPPAQSCPLDLAGLAPGWLCFTLCPVLQIMLTAKFRFIYANFGASKALQGDDQLLNPSLCLKWLANYVSRNRWLYKTGFSAVIVPYTHFVSLHSFSLTSCHFSFGKRVIFSLYGSGRGCKEQLMFL